MMEFAQVAALVIFVLVVCGVIGLVLHPVRLRVSCTTNSHTLPLSYSMVPLVGVLLMLACGSLDGPGLVAGVVGDASLQPYSIVILFMSLAYISSSLDSTGVFAWLAIHITRASRGHGRLLFCLYFALSSLVTLVTSNDIVIMTLTPIVLYFAAATGTDPLPFLTAEFTAANIWSMALFIGNPTNIIVASAYNLTFVGYSKWMVLPTLGAGMTCLAVLLLCHHRHIPTHLTIPDVAPATMLSDRLGAALGTANVLACLALLAAAPSLGWPLWAITLVCAGLHAIYNWVAYVLMRERRGRAAGAGGAEGSSGSGSPSWQLAAAAAAGRRQEEQKLGRNHDTPAGVDLDTMDVWADLRGQPDLELVTIDSPASVGLHRRHSNHHVHHHPDHHHQQQQQQHGQGPVGSQAVIASPLQPEVVLHGEGSSSSIGFGSSSSSRHLPPPSQHQPPALPAGSSPSAAEAAAAAAVADSSGPTAGASAGCPAQNAAAAAVPLPSAGAGPAGLAVREPGFLGGIVQLPWEVVPFVLGMFVLVQGLAQTGWLDLLGGGLGWLVDQHLTLALASVGAISTLLANVMNNQPMTILMTRVLMSQGFLQAAAGSAVNRQAASFALVVGSNLGANFSLIGALAGIMWVSILERQGFKGVGYLQFLRLMAPSGLACTVVSLVILYAEFATFPAGQ